MELDIDNINVTSLVQMGAQQCIYCKPEAIDMGAATSSEERYGMHRVDNPFFSSIQELGL
jgi:hypothetical protein